MRSIHVSPDGSQVVAANNKGRCYVWKLAPDSKFEPLTHIDAHKSYILKALYSPDAKYCHFQPPLPFLNLATPITIVTVIIASTCLRPLLCRILATCSADKTVKLWNTKDYKLLKTLQVSVTSGDRVRPFSIVHHDSSSIRFSSLLLAGPRALGVGLRLLHRLCVSGHRYVTTSA